MGRYCRPYACSVMLLSGTDEVENAGFQALVKQGDIQMFCLFNIHYKPKITIFKS